MFIVVIRDEGRAHDRNLYALGPFETVERAIEYTDSVESDEYIHMDVLELKQP